jgi:hypothetical protein
VDDDVRFDIINGAFQGPFVSQHDVQRESDSYRWQRQRNSQGDSCISDRDDAGIGKDAAG